LGSLVETLFFKYGSKKRSSIGNKKTQPKLVFPCAGSVRDSDAGVRHAGKVGPAAVTNFLPRARLNPTMGKLRAVKNSKSLRGDACQ
jgi:hypothetical protein